MAKVSYSQYTMWANCPQQYKLAYIDKLSESKSNINMVFGTAMHEVLQHYLTVFYGVSKKQANQLDLKGMLLEALKSNFKKEQEKFSDGEVVCTKEELEEFYGDGIEILNWFEKHSDRLFSKKGWELVGVEKVLNLKVAENVNYMGFIDVLLKHKESGEYYIIDFKTSGRGWTKDMKKDKTKINQLLLYKYFLSIQYGIDIEKIKVEYHIIKRKVNKDFEYPIPHISAFIPAHGTNTTLKGYKEFMQFVNSVFNEDGSYNLDGDYTPNPGEKNKNCRWCEFKDRKLCSLFQ
jgi:hypothetical protein